MHRARRSQYPWSGSRGFEPRLAGLLYTPHWCGLVRWADGRAEMPNESVDLDQVYEARFFNNTLELRWLRDPESNGVGQAACLSEESITPNGWTRGSRDDLKPLPGQYLLSGWGCEADDLLYQCN
jgi:hypothetical protein